MAEKFNYTAIQNTASRLLKKFGFDETEAVVMRLVPGVSAVSFYEPDTAFAEWGCPCVVLPLSRTDRDTLIDEGYHQIQKYSKILLSGKELTDELKIGDYILTSDKGYQIFKFKPIKPYNKAVLFSCIVEPCAVPTISVLVQEDGKVITQEDGKAIGVVI